MPNEVVGFKINGSTYEYDHEHLANLPTIDATPTANSTNAVQSGGVKSALDGIQAEIPTVDAIPTQGSTNAVSSDGVYKLKKDFNNINSLSEVVWIEKHYIKTRTDPVNIDDKIVSNGFNCAVSSCVGGEEYWIKGDGAYDGMLWAFIDSDGNKLSHSGTNKESSELIKIKAPFRSTYLVANARNNTENKPLLLKTVFADELNTMLSVNFQNYIDVNVDLFALDYGDYVCPTSAVAATLVNSPTKDIFRLWVLHRAGNVYAKLFVLIDASRKMFMAASSQSSTLDWVKVATDTSVTNGWCNFSVSEYDRAYIDASGNVNDSKSALITKNYISESVFGFKVSELGIKVAIGRWTKNSSKFVRRYWYTKSSAIVENDCCYVFDHANYRYKMYAMKDDESMIIDVDDVAKSIDYLQDTSQLISSTYHGIIDDIFNDDAERKYLSNRIRSIMQDNPSIGNANSNVRLPLKSVYGDNQNVHPKVLYFEEGFGNHKYWMAYTPYPYGESKYENPCIAYSDDGYTWTNISGNPIDEPDDYSIGYMSDTHLVYRPDTGYLECWYRFADTTNMQEIIYRKKSLDGITWGNRETLHTVDSGGSVSKCLSPAVIWDGEKYLIWDVYWGATFKVIEYFESIDGTNWSKIRNIYADYIDGSTVYDAWHIDVIIDNSQYVILSMCKSGSKSWSLFLSTSSDNITYTAPFIVMRGNSYSWDQLMYRSTIVKVGTEYRIYYSALDSEKKHYISLATSNTLVNFIGVFGF